MILAIDTSGSTLGAALWEEDAVLAEIVVEAPRDHCRLLVPAVNCLLDSSARRMADVAGVAVVNGPGFFTGLRVGLAAAKAVAMALGVPVAGVSALEALAHGAWAPGWGRAPSCAGDCGKPGGRAGPAGVLAAGVLKKGMVGAALFLVSEEGLKRAWEDTPVPAAELAARTAEALGPAGAGSVLAVGRGAELMREMGAAAAAAAGLEVVWAPAWANAVRPSVVGKLGAERLLSGEGTDAACLRASYLTSWRNHYRILSRRLQRAEPVSA